MNREIKKDNPKHITGIIAAPEGPIFRPNNPEVIELIKGKNKIFKYIFYRQRKI